MKTRPRHSMVSAGIWRALLCALLPVVAVAVPIQQDASFDPYPVDTESRENLDAQLAQHIINVQHRISRGDYSAALLEVHEALSIAPDHPLLLQYTAHIYGTRGSYVLAEDCWSRLCDMSPDNDYYQAGLAGMYIRQGSMQRAVPLLITALQRNPVSLPARFNLALVRMAEGKADEAREALRARTSTETGQLASWIAEETPLIVRMLGRRGFNELAGFVLEGKPTGRGIEREIQTPEKLRLVAGHIYQASRAAEEKDWSGAVIFLNQARLSGAVAPAVYQDLALYAWLNGNPDKACALLQALRSQFPDHPSVAATLGILSLRDGLEADAVLHLKAAVEADPVNTKALFAMACAYAQAGEFTRSRISLERLQRLLKRHAALRVDTSADYADVLRKNPNLNEYLHAVELMNAPK